MNARGARADSTGDACAETVLVVDDDLAFRQALARALRRHGFKAVVAEDFDSAMEGTVALEDELTINALGFVAFLVVNGYLLATRGQTVGKLAAGTRIVSVADNKILPFHKVILLRYLPVWVIAYVPLIGPILGLVNPLFIFREDRRCLHDHIAGTRVINA